MVTGPQPHLKDGSAYRQNRPTKPDKIKNFSHQVRSGGVIGSSPAHLIGWPDPR